MEGELWVLREREQPSRGVRLRLRDKGETKMLGSKDKIGIEFLQSILEQGCGHRYDAQKVSTIFRKYKPFTMSGKYRSEVKERNDRESIVI